MRIRLAELAWTILDLVGKILIWVGIYLIRLGDAIGIFLAHLLQFAFFLNFCGPKKINFLASKIFINWNSFQKCVLQPVIGNLPRWRSQVPSPVIGNTSTFPSILYWPFPRKSGMDTLAVSDFQSFLKKNSISFSGSNN